MKLEANQKQNSSLWPVNIDARRRRRPARVVAATETSLKLRQEPQLASTTSASDDYLTRHEMLVSRLDESIRLVANNHRHHQHQNAASSLAMNRADANWRRPRQTRSQASTGASSRPQGGSSMCSVARSQHGSSQRNVSATKLALAIFLCLASAISLASSNNTPPTPQTIEGKFCA